MSYKEKEHFWEIALILLLVFATTGLILIFTPGLLALITFGSAALLVAYFLILMRVQPTKGRSKVPPLLILAILILPLFFAAVAFLETYSITRSIASSVVALGLVFTFWSNFLAVPLAVYHKRIEREEPPLESYPLVSIIVPAYNEERVIARTLESLVEADYPNKEIIIVDDGSTDNTLAIASSYEKFGIRVYHKENGGKHSALNYGIRLSKGEIIVTVDADSIVGRDAIKGLVKKFRSEEVSAVCGNIKVLNRMNWVTKCQALEYIASINIFRRAFDLFGAVAVVPGALGAFRRSVLEAGGLYDPDTIVEDFDTTVKTLKAGRIVQASSEALAYTEAPTSLRDLYRQRMRWYRGNFQTIWKHRDAFTNPLFGFLYQITFPFIFLTMVMLPFAGIAVWASAFASLIQGEYLQILAMFLIFVFLQFLLSLLAVEIDGEDRRLVLFSPFFVFGYKQLIDFFHIKALFDVLLKRRVSWTRVRRIGEAGA